jgi:hypothetical protein
MVEMVRKAEEKKRLGKENTYEHLESKSEAETEEETFLPENESEGETEETNEETFEDEDETDEEIQDPQPKVSKPAPKVPKPKPARKVTKVEKRNSTKKRLWRELEETQ